MHTTEAWFGSEGIGCCSFIVKTYARGLPKRLCENNALSLVEVIMVVLWLVFTVLLIIKNTFFAARLFLLQCCFLLLIILQAFRPWSWSHAVLPVPFSWVRLGVTGAVLTPSGLNMTAFCFFGRVFVWVWFDFSRV